MHEPSHHWLGLARQSDETQNAIRKTSVAYKGLSTPMWGEYTPKGGIEKYPVAICHSLLIINGAKKPCLQYRVVSNVKFNYSEQLMVNGFTAAFGL